MPLPFGRGEEEGETPFLTTLPPKKTLQRHPSSITTLPHHHSPTPPPHPPQQKNRSKDIPENPVLTVYFSHFFSGSYGSQRLAGKMCLFLSYHERRTTLPAWDYAREKRTVCITERTICLNIQQKESFKKDHLLLGFIATYCVIVK